MSARRVRLLDRPWMGMRVAFRMTHLPPHDAETVADYLRTRWHLGDRGVRFRHDAGWRLRPVGLEEIGAENPGLVVDLRGIPDAEVSQRLMDGTALPDHGWMTAVVLGDEATYFTIDHSTGDAAYLMETAKQFRVFITDRASWDLRRGRADLRTLALVATRLLLRRPTTLLRIPQRIARRRRSGAEVADVVRSTRSRFASVHVPADRWATLAAWREALPRPVSQPVLVVVGIARQALARGLPADDLLISMIVDLRRYSPRLELFDSNLITPLLSEVDVRDPDTLVTLTAGWRRSLLSGLPAVATVASGITWLRRRPAQHAPAATQVGTSHMTIPSLVDTSGAGVLTEIMFPAKPRTIDVVVHPVTDGTMVNVSWDATLLSEDTMTSLLADLARDPLGFLTSTESTHA